MEQYWALLDELDPDELLVHLPGWRAEEKTGYVEGAGATIDKKYPTSYTFKDGRLTGC